MTSGKGVMEPRKDGVLFSVARPPPYQRGVPLGFTGYSPGSAGIRREMNLYEYPV